MRTGPFAGLLRWGVEPALRVRVQHWHVKSGTLPFNPLKIAVLSDLHAGTPNVTAERLTRIVARTNALGADVILLPGDFSATQTYFSRALPAAEIARLMGNLSAPLGVWAVLGNHDWWEDSDAQKQGEGPIHWHRLLGNVGIRVLENEAVLLDNGMWLAGLADQHAIRGKFRRHAGVHDLDRTLASVPQDVPLLFLAHEPDIFPELPDRVTLAVCGHTHGGQIRLFGRAPFVPSKFESRYSYGHIVEGDRHVVVSGGIGCSMVPVRLGVVPEITLITLGPDL
ncbi:MAG: metallophosphoesterase [Paracoccaceae bacterium]